MKTRIFVTAILIVLISFAIGAIGSFLSAYVFVSPNAKFTGWGAFHLGLLASAWISFCFGFSFLATAPIFSRLFHLRSFRHALLLGAIHVAVLLVAFRSPPAQVLMGALRQIARVFTRNEIAQVAIVSLGTSVAVAALFHVLAYAARQALRRWLRSAA